MRNKDEVEMAARILEGFPGPCSTLFLPMLPGTPLPALMVSEPTERRLSLPFFSSPSTWRQLGVEGKDRLWNQLDLGLKPGAVTVLLSGLQSCALSEPWFPQLRKEDRNP